MFCARAGIAVDSLVNNAGFGQYGLFAENDLEECLRQIQLNITTLTHLTRLYLPEMLERKSGHILNVASTAAFQPGPLMAVYFATKAYVLHFSEAIANELAGNRKAEGLDLVRPDDAGIDLAQGDEGPDHES